VTAAREMSAKGRESNDKGTKWEELFCSKVAILTGLWSLQQWKEVRMRWKPPLYWDQRPLCCEF
jgi:hypothetical protein